MSYLLDEKMKMSLYEIRCGSCDKIIGKVDINIFDCIDEDVDFQGNELIYCLDCANKGV